MWTSKDIGMACDESQQQFERKSYEKYEELKNSY